MHLRVNASGMAASGPQNLFGSQLLDCIQAKVILMSMLAIVDGQL